MLKLLRAGKFAQVSPNQLPWLDAKDLGRGRVGKCEGLILIDDAHALTLVFNQQAVAAFTFMLCLLDFVAVFP